MPSPTPSIDYGTIAQESGFVYVGPCGCRGKKGYDYQRGIYVLRCYPASQLFNVYRYGRLFRSGTMGQLSKTLKELPA